MADQMTETEKVREIVRARYAAAARSVQPVAGSAASCCGAGDGAVAAEEAVFGGSLYDDADRRELPGAAVAASLGCGTPTAVAELNAGETVLDLGSGGGIDVLLSAQRVGPTGKAYGLDMTDETRREFLDAATAAGLVDVEIAETHRVHEKAASAIVRARKPASAPLRQD